MSLTIRELGRRDEEAWLDLYRGLFPDEAREGLRKDIRRILKDRARKAFIAEIDGMPAGFAEYALRPYANGCYSMPVPFLEGIYVVPEHRRKGVAKALVAHLEALARAGGHREMGSDVLWDNLLSLDVHRQLGFKETERVVYFRKEL